MSRLPINLFSCFVFVLVSGCGFVDLRPIEYSTVPEHEYAILPGPYSPAGLNFNTAMHESETKKCLQILGIYGSVEGEFIWEGNKLSFVPESPWLAGVRYVMKLSGTARSTDGRELILSREIPFYAVSCSALPYLVSFSPADGASTGIFDAGGIVFTFAFSEPMDRQSTETAFACDGIGDKEFQWLDDDKVLTVSSRNALNAWTVYRWTISEKALSRSGAPLAKEVSGRFITDEDRVFPRMTKILPLVKSEEKGAWGFWVPVDTNLENGLGNGQAIGMEFNKAMESESLKRSFSFDPSLPGRVEQPLPNRAVFVPDRNTEPETVYTMKISRELKDEGGLKLGQDHFHPFVSDIPYLGIHSFAPDLPGEPDRIGDQFNPKNNDVFGVPVSEGDDGALRFTIWFSLPFTDEAMRDMTFRISLESFFPGTLRPAALKAIRWYSPYLLRMEWEGLQAGKPDEPHYYRLTIPGGRSGFANGSGSYLKEDFVFIIEALES